MAGAGRAGSPGGAASCLLLTRPALGGCALRPRRPPWFKGAPRWAALRRLCLWEGHTGGRAGLAWQLLHYGLGNGGVPGSPGPQFSVCKRGE